MRLYERLSSSSGLFEAAEQTTSVVENLKFMLDLSTKQFLLCLQERDVLNESFLFELRDLQFSQVSCT